MDTRLLQRVVREADLAVAPAPAEYHFAHPFYRFAALRACLKSDAALRYAVSRCSWYGNTPPPYYAMHIEFGELGAGRRVPR